MTPIPASKRTAELGNSGEELEVAGQNKANSAPDENAEVEEDSAPTTKAAGPQRVLFGLPNPPPSVYADWWKMRQEYFTAAWARLEAESARTGPIRTPENVPSTAKNRVLK